jgi:folate-binding protein YgfZ
MTSTQIAHLPDRGVVAVRGPDARKLLQGLITNDMDALASAGDAIHAGLLSPQGKILFAFFVIATADGFLLETEYEQVGALAKRLSFYKLRAAVSIENTAENFAVAVVWGPFPRAGDDSPESHGSTFAGTPAFPAPSQQDGAAPISAPAYHFRDPRHPSLGLRFVAPASSLPKANAGIADYHAHRIALGVPEAQFDYPLGDTYPHEADFDLFHGADFRKGCFIGQEVVARMQHKTVVRKRVVRIAAGTPLPNDQPAITAGAADVGRLGSVVGRLGLALVRLDRAAQAMDKGEPLLAAGIPLTVADETFDAYRAAIATGPSTP